MIKIRQGATKPDLRLQCVRDGKAVDLSDATSVMLRMTLPDNTVVDRPVTVENQSRRKGDVRYEWLGNDVLETGTIECVVRVEWGLQGVESFPATGSEKVFVVSPSSGEGVPSEVHVPGPQGPVGPAGPQGVQGEVGPAGPVWGTNEHVVSILDFGAERNSSADSATAINAACQWAHDNGGGTVIVPPGFYTLLSPIGPGEGDRWQHVRLTGVGNRGIAWGWGADAEHVGASVLMVSHTVSNVPVISGEWESCRIENLCLNANMRGGSSIYAWFSKSVIADVECVRWSGVGVWIGHDGFTDDLGYMNRMVRVTVSDSGSENGTGMQLEYRWADSLIDSCNIEAPGTDLVLNSGGPYRVVNTWFNGNRSPIHNIEVPDGVREVILSNCVFEGAEKEAIKFAGSGSLTEPERCSVTITGNIFRQFGQDDSGSWSAIKLDGSAGGEGYRAQNFVVTGNVITTDYYPKHVVEAVDVDGLSCVGNGWVAGHHSELAPVSVTDCTGVEVVGNGGDNAVDDGVE